MLCPSKKKPTLGQERANLQPLPHVTALHGSAGVLQQQRMLHTLSTSLIVRVCFFECSHLRYEHWLGSKQLGIGPHNSTAVECG